MEKTSLIIVGAGPIGIEVAALMKRQKQQYLHFERGQIGDTMLRRWPPGARFFSSPERVAVAGIPIQSVSQEMMPREEYLAYLRSVVEILELDIKTYHDVVGIERGENGFILTVSSNRGVFQVSSTYVVLATGDMAYPTRLDIPGEHLPHVHHVMREPHEYFGKEIVIIGGKNSAVENAIRCWRSGARVTLCVRRNKLEPMRLNSRLGLEIGILTGKDRIGLMTGVTAKTITEGAVTFTGPVGDVEIAADFVLINAGYQADLSLMNMAGVTLEGEEDIPIVDSATMETDVPGLFLAGTASGGNRESYKIFIGTSHGHAKAILKAISGIDSDEVNTIESRRYPFSIKDIESKDM